MDSSVDVVPPLVAAPRHLRKRAFRRDIPDTLFVPGVQPHTRQTASARGPASKRAADTADPKESAYRRKRLVALFVVLVIVVSIPALAIALILAG